jgi:hypothetical protein
MRCLLFVAIEFRRATSKPRKATAIVWKPSRSHLRPTSSSPLASANELAALLARRT